MRPEFGEATGDIRAEAAIYVRRPLNEYAGIDEVFKFYWTEPEVSQAERQPYPGVKYILTRESKTGVPGVKDERAIFSSSMMHPEKVPNDILERAAEMVDWIEVNPDED